MNGFEKYKDLLADVDRILREMPGKSVDPPAHLRAKILAGLPEEPLSPARHRWGRWAAGFAAVAACILAAAVIYRGPATPPLMPAATERTPLPAAAKAPPPPSAPRNATASAAPRKAVQPPVEREGVVREVKISFFYPSAKSVAVTGDFNGWSQEGVLLAAGERGHWKATLRLPPGVYSYNFIVDGNLLVPDPNASVQTPDGFGGTNSILLVNGGKSA